MVSKCGIWIIGSLRRCRIVCFYCSASSNLIPSFPKNSREAQIPQSQRTITTVPPPAMLAAEKVGTKHAAGRSIQSIKTRPGWIDEITLPISNARPPTLLPCETLEYPVPQITLLLCSPYRLFSLAENKTLTPKLWEGYLRDT